MTEEIEQIPLPNAELGRQRFNVATDARDFPGLIDFGLKGGFRLPSGLNAGQHVELLLDRIALPYYDLTDFDQLPTPFRCVAADINRGEPVVLRNGSLSRALRAWSI